MQAPLASVCKGWASLCFRVQRGWKAPCGFRAEPMRRFQKGAKATL